MDALTKLFKRHHKDLFELHGPTAKGVDWRDHEEMMFRYGKMLTVLDHDFERPKGVPTLLDVGCGWGGLCAYAAEKRVKVAYTGIDIVPDMIRYAKRHFNDGRFVVKDVLSLHKENAFDYVVCNGSLTQKLTASIPEMEQFADRMLRKMFALCRYGMAANFMSTRVNYMVDNLYYRHPADLLSYCLMELSPRVRIDHGYSNLRRGKNKLYDYTVYLYKD